MERIRKHAFFLYTISGLFFISPFIAYWIIHGDYERYMWIINQSYPLSHLGSFGYQATLYGTLFLIGIGVLLIALGIQFSRRILSILGAVVIGVAMVGCSIVLTSQAGLDIRKPNWHQPSATLPAMSDSELTEFGIEPSAIPDGWYAHQTSDQSLHITTTKTEQVRLHTDGGPDGIYLTIHDIEGSPETWIENWINFDDEGVTRDYEWNFRNGIRHLRYEFEGLGPEKRSDYFLSDNRVIEATLQPRDAEAKLRQLYLQLLNTIAIPLTLTGDNDSGEFGDQASYSRRSLRENCAQDVSDKRIDDISINEPHETATLHWTDYDTNENQRLTVAYEPSTEFSGCSASVTSLLADRADAVRFSCPNDYQFTMIYLGEENTEAILQLPAAETYRVSVARSGSGARYTNEDESVVFWEHQGEASIEVDGELVRERCVISGN